MSHRSSRRIEFKGFINANPEDLSEILNETKVRTHLVNHAYFDAARLRQWIEAKMQTDSLPGCRVRAVYIDGVLAGWCGIQPDNNGFELAVVLSQRFWGAGFSIFKTLMDWAKELGHEEILVHLLNSRLESRFLKKMSSRVVSTALLGGNFTTYYIAVGA